MSGNSKAKKASQWREELLARHQLPASYLDDAQKWFDPLAESLAVLQNGAARPVLVAMNGCQGSGKTTVCDYLRAYLEAEHGLAVVALSLDDFYLSQHDRMALARRVHPLFATRGVPGTHDMALLASTLDSLLEPAAGDSIAIPRFDKALDDRRPASGWDRVEARVDIVLLEGWCLGARSQSEQELSQPVNALEREEDPDLRWRRYGNAILGQDFEALYTRVDQWVMLQAPSFECVYRWRMEQEVKLAATSAGQGAGVMDATRLARFIHFYERLTRQCLSQLPDKVDYLYQLDEQRQIVSFSAVEER